jgi:hypothetical protein
MLFLITGNQMKLTIFGASGQTGKPLVSLALNAGHEVVAFVRDPSKLGIEHKNLKIVSGDVTNQDAVDKAIQGSNAIISVLNTSVNAKNKPITSGMQNIIASMNRYGVRRIIMSASAPCSNDPNDIPNFKYNLITAFVGFLVKFLFRFSYDDLKSSVQIVKSSDTDWTVVRMPIPTNDRKPVPMKAGFVDKNTNLLISRINAASFMLKEVQEAKYVKQTPVIFNI